MSAVRRDVEELAALVRRARAVKAGEGLYGPLGRQGRHQASGRTVAQAKAMAHELDTLAAIVVRLDKATAPKQVPYLRLPAEGSAARTLLEVLHLDAQGHDHRGLRELAGLTDAELAVRITGPGPNTLRPRRLDLQRTGWVRDSGRSVGRLTVWELTDDGRRAMAGLAREVRTHLMDEYLLDACGTAPRPGSLSVTTTREHVDCLACLRLPVPAPEEVAAGG